MEAPKDIFRTIKNRSTRLASIGNPGIEIISAGEVVLQSRIAISTIESFTDIFELIQ